MIGSRTSSVMESLQFKRFWCAMSFLLASTNTAEIRSKLGSWQDIITSAGVAHRSLCMRLALLSDALSGLRSLSLWCLVGFRVRSITLLLSLTYSDRLNDSKATKPFRQPKFHKFSSPVKCRKRQGRRLRSVPSVSTTTRTHGYYPRVGIPSAPAACRSSSALLRALPQSLVRNAVSTRAYRGTDFRRISGFLVRASKTRVCRTLAKTLWVHASLSRPSRQGKNAIIGPAM